MSNNILHLKRKYKNVVDLNDRTLLYRNKKNVVDMRAERNVRKESFDNVLARKVYGGEAPKEKRTIRASKQAYFSSIAKSLAILLIVSLNGFALTQVGNTFSILNDIESSIDNHHIAGVIDFELTLSPFSNDAWQNLVEGTSTAQDVDVLPNVVSNPFFYYASSTNFVGDDVFCEAIQVVATLDGDQIYSGPLHDLLTATTTNIAIWNLEFTNDVKFFNSVCQFDIDFNGWQTRHDYPKYHDGFSDTERTTHILYSDGLKINKIYFEAHDPMCRMNMDDHFLTEDDPRLDRGERGERQDGREVWPHPDRDCYDGRGREDSPRNTSSSTEETNENSSTSTLPHYEWVEIYNPNNEPADIDGWTICDGQACDTLNASEPIPAFGYAIIVGEIGHLEGWITPSDFVIITVDDGVIGDGLDNENDGLTLRRPDNFIFDAVNWGIPDVLWPYYVEEFWNPGVLGMTEGTMIARIPTGFDTNQPSDFQVLYIPAVDLLYPGDVVEGKWFWGFTYLVTWLAENPNGLPEDLLIDIWMIRDTNGNGYPDGGDEHLHLKEKIANDGNEEITVPDGFLGTIWIKLIATGPENPMTHGFDFSGPIDDPIPNFMLEDEDKSEVMQQAVIDQLNRDGESDFAHILIVPHTPEIVEETGTSTASSTDEVANEVDSVVSDNVEISATSTPTIDGSEETATSTEEVVLDEETASSTDDMGEEVTFKEEIDELIEEFIEENSLPEGDAESGAADEVDDSASESPAIGESEEPVNEEGEEESAVEQEEATIEPEEVVIEESNEE